MDINEGKKELILQQPEERRKTRKIKKVKLTQEKVGLAGKWASEEAEKCNFEVIIHKKGKILQ